MQLVGVEPSEGAALLGLAPARRAAEGRRGSRQIEPGQQAVARAPDRELWGGHGLRVRLTVELDGWLARLASPAAVVQEELADAAHLSAAHLLTAARGDVASANVRVVCEDVGDAQRNREDFRRPLEHVPSGHDLAQDRGEQLDERVAVVREVVARRHSAKTRALRQQMPRVEYVGPPARNARVDTIPHDGDIQVKIAARHCHTHELCNHRLGERVRLIQCLARVVIVSLMDQRPTLEDQKAISLTNPTDGFGGLLEPKRG